MAKRGEHASRAAGVWTEERGASGGPRAARATKERGHMSRSRMSDLETLMWRSERHPQLSSTVTALLLLDEPPDWDRLCAAHERATHLIPRCRQRVLEPALPVGP